MDVHPTKDGILIGIDPYPSFSIFLHLFKALQGRPLDEVVGVHRLLPAPAKVDRNGQKIQWIIYEWYVNIIKIQMISE